MNRFASLAWVFVVVACVASTRGSGQPAAGEAKPAAGPLKEELLLVGPFSLRDVYDKMSPPDLGQRIADDAGVNQGDIRKAMGRCRFYFVDKVKMTTFEGKPFKKFTDDRAYPKVLVEGELAFELKDKKGKPADLSIRQVKRATGGMDSSLKPLRRLATLYVEVIGVKFQRSIGAPRIRATFTTDLYLSYDVNGKQLDWRDLDGRNTEPITLR